jgi:hypothetical protein
LARVGLGDQIYDLAAQGYWVEQATGHVLDAAPVGFAYLPHFALAIAPLTWLSYDVAERLWFGLNAVTLVVLGLVLWRLAAPAPGWQRALLLACMVSSDAVFYVMGAGQVSALLVLVLATSLLLLRRGHEATAGGVLALMTIKPQLVVGVLLLLALRARWRALLAFALTASALLLAPLPFLGPSVYVEHFQFLTSVTGTDGISGVNYAHMHTWRGFLASFGLDRSEFIFVGTFLLMTVITIPIALWAWRSGPVRGDGHGNQEWGLAILFPLLLTPYLWTQELMLLAFVGALALSELAQARVDVRHHLGVAAVVLAGYVILSEAWVLTRQDISLTIFPLLAAFLWTCLRPWGSEKGVDAEHADEHPDEFVEAA